MEYTAEFHQFLDKLEAETGHHNLIEAIRKGYKITHPLNEGIVKEGMGCIAPILGFGLLTLLSNCSHYIMGLYNEDKYNSKEYIQQYNNAVDEIKNTVIYIPDNMSAYFPSDPGINDVIRQANNDMKMYSRQGTSKLAQYWYDHYHSTESPLSEDAIALHTSAEQVQKTARDVNWQIKAMDAKLYGKKADDGIVDGYRLPSECTDHALGVKLADDMSELNNRIKSLKSAVTNYLTCKSKVSLNPANAEFVEFKEEPNYTDEIDNAAFVQTCRGHRY